MWSAIERHQIELEHAMKTKGMKPLEQHVEKLVLGVSLLALVGVAGWQLVHSPNEVKLGSQTVDPGEIAKVIGVKSNTVKALLDSDQASITIPKDGLDPAADTEVEVGRGQGDGIAFGFDEHIL